jgi:transcriptional regulator with XRE-family HTH domain
MDFSYLDKPERASRTPGEKIRRERMRRNWSQGLLAKTMEVTPAQVSRLENNVCKISPRRAVDLEKILGIPREALRPDIFADRRKKKMPKEHAVACAC